jgi:V/A-type H+-transporting ATPase subunit C
MNQERYLFATGAIREAERRLISKGDMERMIEAPDAEQSFKVFNDLSYVDELLEIKQPDRFVDILTHDLGQVKDFINTMIDNPLLLKLIFAADDFFNFKLLFKALTGKQDITEELSKLGYIDGEKLKSYISDNMISLSIGHDYEGIINRAKEEINENTSPEEIDIYFEKQYFIFIQNLSQLLGNSRVSRIIGCQTDNANIKIVFRSHILGRTRDQALDSLISGGQFDVAEMAGYVQLDEADIIDKLSVKISDQITVSQLRELSGNFELWRLEKVLDDQLLRIIKEVKMATAGPAVLYAYYLGKRNAIKNISSIMTGKLNRISPEEIKTRIRELY